MDICSSPQLFAAYHVFLRLLVPRHPPCALFCLTSYFPFPIALGNGVFAILDCLVCLQTFVYKTFLVCYFSDVLIKIFIFLNLSLCMKFSRYNPPSFRLANGDGEIRTLDPLLARQVLSQLSYTPIMGLSGLEPPTSRLSGVRSNRLSYKPI